MLIRLVCLEGGSRYDTEFYELEESYYQQLRTYVDSGQAEGDVWASLLEVRTLLEGLGRRREGGSSLGKSLLELTFRQREILVIWLIREYFDEAPPVNSPAWKDSMEWSMDESFDIW